MNDEFNPAPSEFTERFQQGSRLLTELKARIECISRLVQAAPPSTGAPRLLFFDQKGICRSVDLKGSLTLGRGRQVDISFECRKVSRQHCRISPTPEGVLVEDLASSNGTFVNGLPVILTLVESGDLIDLGGGEARLALLIDEEF